MKSDVNINPSIFRLLSELVDNQIGSDDIQNKFNNIVLSSFFYLSSKKLGRKI